MDVNLLKLAQPVSIKTKEGEPVPSNTKFPGKQKKVFRNKSMNIWGKGFYGHANPHKIPLFYL